MDSIDDMKSRKNQYYTSDFPKGSTPINQKNEVFDLTKLQEYPLRLLRICHNHGQNKVLCFREIKVEDIFVFGENYPGKYMLIGKMNRSNLSKEYIIENVEELYNAIEKYIAGALFKRLDPLGYFLVSFNRVFDLREYKRLFAKSEPMQTK
ncbi:MAG: hypothetical protein ACW99A_16740 [Candidatus Kariarchaeaceae archaeon]